MAGAGGAVPESDAREERDERTREPTKKLEVRACPINKYLGLRAGAGSLTGSRVSDPPRVSWARRQRCG